MWIPAQRAKVISTQRPRYAFSALALVVGACPPPPLMSALPPQACPMSTGCWLLFTYDNYDGKFSWIGDAWICRCICSWVAIWQCARWVCIDSLIQALETPMVIITNRKNPSELGLKYCKNQAVDSFHRLLQKRDAHSRTSIYQWLGWTRKDSCHSFCSEERIWTKWVGISFYISDR